MTTEDTTKHSVANADAAARDNADPTDGPTQEEREKSLRVRACNDLVRVGASSGRLVVTDGIRAKGPAFEKAALETVQTYEAFTPDNDPSGEHDFGDFELEGERCFWTIDCYDTALENGSPDPADPAVTIRVLTILLADEY